jgi:phosphatidylglycerol---prolipoprotein diacylglyceryl transferase
MPQPVTSIGPLTVQTYTLLVGLGIVLAIGIVLVFYRLRFVTHSGAIIDVCLAGLVGGLVVGRAFHVLLNWIYFRENTAEIIRIVSGGINWHGAVIGALLVIIPATRLRRVRLPLLLDGMALALPLVAFMAWWGCGAARCAYGAEVDNLSHYPSFVVWETQDIFNLRAPRYATQPLGMWLGAGLLTVMSVTHWRQLFAGRRFWLALALFAGGMFVLGFLRGDYALIVAGLRADQGLDLALVALGIVFLLRRS